MRRTLALLLLCAMAVEASARPIEFSGIGRGSKVRLVLADGTQCAGKVQSRTGDSLSVKLTAASPCGARDVTVVVLQSRTSGIERTEASTGRKVGATTAGLFAGLTVMGAGAQAGVRGGAGLGALLAGLVGVAVGVDHLVRRGSGYTLFVSRLQ